MALSLFSPRQLVKDYVFNIVFEKVKTRLKSGLRSVLTAGEQVSTAIITTGAYSYIKTVKALSGYTPNDTKIATTFNKFTSLFYENSEQPRPHNLVVIPSLTVTCLTLLAALTVSAVDTALRDSMKNQVVPKRSLLEKAKSRVERLVSGKPKSTEDKDKMHVILQKITNYKTIQIVLLRDKIKKQAIRTLPGVALSALFAVPLGFAATDGVALYFLYRSALKVKESVVNFADFPPVKSTDEKKPSTNKSTEKPEKSEKSDKKHSAKAVVNG